MNRIARSVALLALLVPTLGCGFVNTVGHFFGASPLLDDFIPRSVFMLSPKEGWVVGNSVRTQAPPAPIIGIALHRHNGTWSRVTIPTFGFDRVFALSPTDAWALDSSTGMYHWNGSAWQLVPADIGPRSFESLYLFDLYMLSPLEGWAVGSRAILHYTAGQWVDATSLATNPGRLDNGTIFLSIESISMVSTTDGWAVGNYGVIRHYDGKVWQLVDSPVASPVTPPAQANVVNLSAVWMMSATDGWAVGTEEISWDTETSIILHYSGGTWSVAYKRPTRPNTSVALKSLAMVSPTEGWAAGVEEDSSPMGNNFAVASFLSYVLHYKAGRWARIPVPGQAIYSLSMSTPDDGWAISGNGLIHYHHGVWTEELRGA